MPYNFILQNPTSPRDNGSFSGYRLIVCVTAHMDIMRSAMALLDVVEKTGKSHILESKIPVERVVKNLLYLISESSRMVSDEKASN